MADINVEGLAEAISYAIKTTNGYIKTISENLAWEKWFQCTLYALLQSQDVEVYCEACMDDKRGTQGKRNDFLFLNDDGSVMLAELKCSSKNTDLNITVNGFGKDMEKLDRYEGYERCCILIIPYSHVPEIEEQNDLPDIQEWANLDQEAEKRADFGNLIKCAQILKKGIVNGGWNCSGMFYDGFMVALAYKERPVE